jgi:AcrR family transcriptional regulator
MQYAKDEIRQRIIDVAREEFLEKGFEKASIRTITAKAKTSKSNLYNYFKDKDHMFYSVLEPTLTKIQNGLELAKSYSIANGVVAYTKEAQKHNAFMILEFVYENLADVKLLLFQAQGSSLESFKDKTIDTFADILCSWVKENAPNKKVSRFFVRCISSFYLSAIEQLIINGVSKEQVKQNDEFICFIYYGWNGILQ